MINCIVRFGLHLWLVVLEVTHVIALCLVLLLIVGTLGVRFGL